MRLIDADTLIAYIDAQKGRPFIGCTIGEALKILVDEQPTIEPERKKGTWIDMDDHLLCSCCGATHYGNDKNFCPNCGAQMEEVQNLVYADGDTAYGGLQSAT